MRASLVFTPSLRLLSLAVLVLTLASCSGESGSAAEPDAVGELDGDADVGDAERIDAPTAEEDATAGDTSAEDATAGDISEGDGSGSGVPPAAFRERWMSSLVSFTFGAPSALDVNGDGVLDVLFSTGIEGVSGGAVALDGRDGTTLWSHEVADQLFTVPVRFDAASGDGLLFGGRGAELLAVDADTGDLLWSFARDHAGTGTWFNFYACQRAPDVDGDGLGDLLCANGGDPSIEPFEPRQAGQLAVLSAASGAPLRVAPMPEPTETYAPATWLDDPSSGQGARIVFGTGGESIAGATWLTTWGDVLAEDLTGSVRLSAEGGSRGWIASPTIGDFTGDGARDLAVASMDGQVRVIDGASLEAVWTDALAGHGTYASVIPADMDGDGGDELASVRMRGDYPDFDRSVVHVHARGDGERVASWETDGAWSFGGVLALDLDDDGRDELLGLIDTFEDEADATWELRRYDLEADEANVVASGPGLALSTPLIEDIDGDGWWDLVFTVVVDGGGEGEEYRPESQTRVLELGVPSSVAPAWPARMGRAHDGWAR